MYRWCVHELLHQPISLSHRIDTLLPDNLPAVAFSVDVVIVELSGEKIYGAIKVFNTFDQYKLCISLCSTARLCLSATALEKLHIDSREYKLAVGGSNQSVAVIGFLILPVLDAPRLVSVGVVHGRLGEA